MKKILNKKTAQIIFFILIAFLMEYLYILYSYRTGYDFECGAVLRQAEDFCGGNIFFKNWHSSAVLGILTRNITVTFGYIIFGFKDMAIYVAGATAYFLLVLGSCILGGNGDLKKYSYKNAFITLCFLIIPPAQYSYLLVRTETHIETYALGLFIFVIVDYIDKKSEIKLKYLLLTLSVFSIVISDDHGLYAFILPIVITIILRNIINLMKGEKISVKEKHILLLIVSSFVFAKAVLKVANHFHYMIFTNSGSRNFNSYDNVFISLKNAIRILLEFFNANFFSKPIFSLEFLKSLIGLGAFLIAILVLIICIKKINKLNLISQSIIIGFLVFLLCYIFTDIGNQYGLSEIPRYLVPNFIFLTILVGREGKVLVDIVPKQWDKKILKVFYLIVVIFIVAIPLSRVIHLSNEKSNTPHGNSDIYKLSDYLLSHGLQTGYSGYSGSYKLDVASQGRLKVLPVVFEGTKVKQNVWFSKDDDYQEYANFVIAPIEDGGLDYENCNDDMLKKYFGDPISKLQYENCNIWIWNYDISSKVSPLDLKISDTVPCNTLLTNENGMYNFENDSITLKQGGVQYGPYMALDKGEYELIAEGSNLNMVNFDVYCGENQVEYKINEQSSEIINCTIRLTKDVNNMEFRMLNYGEEDVVINKYYIKK